jgi:hypothetical protein
MTSPESGRDASVNSELFVYTLALNVSDRPVHQWFVEGNGFVPSQHQRW